jgi:hypothetical protein
MSVLPRAHRVQLSAPPTNVRRGIVSVIHGRRRIHAIGAGTNRLNLLAARSLDSCNGIGTRTVAIFEAANLRTTPDDDNDPVPK